MLEVLKCKNTIGQKTFEQRSIVRSFVTYSGFHCL